MSRHDPVFAAEFGALATEFYSPRRCFAHYLHMAFGNWRDYLRLARPPSATIPLRRLGGREEVSLKKTRGGRARQSRRVRRAR